MKLSLILPCYNVGKYIDDCLKSIYSQDLPENEYEVICVNDCSTDNTVEIINSYKSRHNNLILIEHTENKNLGAARNTGYNISKGKYVWFIDSDDYIVENCLLKIVNELDRNNLEILEFNINSTDKSKNQTFLEVNFQTGTEVITGIEYMYNLMNWGWGRKLEVWRRVFKKEFFQNNKLVFSESLYGIEDLVLFYQSMLVCKRFRHITDYFYFYRTNNSESITNSKKSLGIKLAVKILAIIEVIKIFHEDKIIQDENFKIRAAETYHWSIRKCYKKIFSLDKENIQQYLGIIKKQKQIIKKYGTNTEYFLTTNTLFVKCINTIFAPLIEFRNYLKKN